MPDRVILLVEDDSYNRDILREILEELDGCAVVEATNGAEALAWIEANPSPALVLLDMMMPEMDGYTLLQRLRQGGRGDIRVIGISARARTGDEEKALAAGCWRYLTKPFNIAEVESIVQDGLSLP
jgi:CheY-like chemotaxis protein